MIAKIAVYYIIFMLRKITEHTNRLTFRKYKPRNVHIFSDWRIVHCFLITMSVLDCMHTVQKNTPS